MRRAHGGLGVLLGLAAVVVAAYAVAVVLAAYVFAR